MRRYIILLLIFISFSAYSQFVNICSWNIQNFGKSKNETELTYIASVVKDFDLIAIQEVVSGYGGSQAVAKLADELNRLGFHWDYVISNQTSGGSSRERYAFIWNTAKVKRIGEPWLENNFEQLIQREPYLCRFEVGKKIFTLAGFHAVPKSKQPASEIKYFKFIPGLYPDDHIIFCGDFNLPQSHTVFDPLRRIGYMPALIGKKTSLKQSCINGNCLASEYDNFYFPTSKIKLLGSGVVHFYQDFKNFKTARLISDHTPVYIQLSLDRTAK